MTQIIPVPLCSAVNSTGTMMSDIGVLQYKKKPKKQKNTLNFLTSSQIFTWMSGGGDRVVGIHTLQRSQLKNKSKVSIFWILATWEQC